MSKPIIEVKNLAKCYRLGSLGATSFAEDIGALWKRLRGHKEEIDPRVLEQLKKQGKDSNELNREEKNRFWALQDISFEVQPGEVVGIIGKNGAGKSTLLKILSRITEPTHGEAFMRGRVGSLLEVGTGFHGDLTGRENVYLNGAIHGLTRQDIDEKFNDILGFAQMSKFIDTPVKRYSSGMYVRLAFAVAAFLDPEILIVDEVLAVGDAGFQKRCTDKMESISKQGQTILLVSHNMSTIRNICSRVIIIDGGRVVFNGDTNSAVDYYLGVNHESKKDNAILLKHKILEDYDGSYDKANPFILIDKIVLSGKYGEARNKFKSSEDIYIDLNFSIKRSVGDFRLIISIHTPQGEMLISSQMSDVIPDSKMIRVGDYDARMVIPGKTFGSHKYIVRFDFIDVKQEHISLNASLNFEVSYDTCEYGYCDRANYYIRPIWDWKIAEA